MTADPRADELRRGAVERDMRCAVFDAIMSTPKIPYTDEGVGIITRAISDYCNTFRERTGREYGEVVMEHVGVDAFVRFADGMTFALWLDILEETRRSFRPIDLTARLAYDDDPAFGDWSPPPPPLEIPKAPANVARFALTALVAARGVP